MVSVVARSMSMASSVIWASASTDMVGGGGGGIGVAARGWIGVDDRRNQGTDMRDARCS